MKSYKTLVTFPNTFKTRVFRSERAVARMLSGDGTASGGLRRQIGRAAAYGDPVRRNWVLNQQVALDLFIDMAA